MAFNPVLNPDSLAVLKRRLGLTPPEEDQPVYSEGVQEVDPSLAVEPDRAHGETNASLKQLLGIPEPQFVTDQRANLAARDKAISEAQTAQNPDVQAESDAKLADEIRAKSAPAIAIENNKAANEQTAQDRQNAATQEILNRMNGGGGGAPGAGGGPVGMKPSINAKNQVSFAPVMPTAAVQTQQHAASIGLQELEKTSQMVDDLNRRGLLGPVAGPANDAFTRTGFDKYLMHPQDAQAFNAFKNQLSLTKSNIGYVHGGTRGGSSKALLDRFDNLVNTSQSPEAMRGALDAYKNWLSEYANVPNEDVAGQEAISEKYLSLLGGH